MENIKQVNYLRLVVTAAILTLTSSFTLVANGAQMSPKLAAKKEMVRKQQEQRVTPEKRKAAADALKEERRKVYNAKKAVTPPVSEQNQSKDNK